MKIQLIILIAFAVATYALPQRSEEDRNRRRHYRGGHQNGNQLSANAEDESNENSNSSDELTTERVGCNHEHKEQIGNRRHHKRTWHRKNNSETNEGEGAQFNDNYDWQRNSMTEENSETKNHHKHHHHRHHHHKNRTTTIPTTTTQQPQETPFSELEEVVIKSQDIDRTEIFNSP